MGNNNPSPVLDTITGLNDYLANFGEILAEKIQTSLNLNLCLVKIRMMNLQIL